MAETTEEGSTSPKISGTDTKKKAEKKVPKTTSEDKRPNVLGTFFNKILMVGRSSSVKRVRKQSKKVHVYVKYTVIS